MSTLPSWYSICAFFLLRDLQNPLLASELKLKS